MDAPADDVTRALRLLERERERYRKRYQRNRETILNRSKEYYRQNREAILERRRQQRQPVGDTPAPVAATLPDGQPHPLAQ